RRLLPAPPSDWRQRHAQQRHVSWRHDMPPGLRPTAEMFLLQAAGHRPRPYAPVAMVMAAAMAKTAAHNRCSPAPGTPAAPRLAIDHIGFEFERQATAPPGKAHPDARPPGYRRPQPTRKSIPGPQSPWPNAGRRPQERTGATAA